MKRDLKGMSWALRARLTWMGLVLAQFGPGFAHAGWPTDPMSNVPVCTTGGTCASVGLTSDGQGGAIAVWYEDRNNFEVFARRVTSQGDPIWEPDGNPVLDDVDSHRFFPRAIADGEGGVIVVWSDSRSDLGLFAQRFDSNGNRLWDTGGVAVSPTARYSDSEREVAIVSDGNGGAVIAWSDPRDDPEGDIYAQRLDRFGNPQWGSGRAVCTATGSQTYPSTAHLSSGRTAIAWVDHRAGTPRVYAQLLDGTTGASQWTGGGKLVSDPSGDAGDAWIMPDAGQGAIVVWQSATMIRAQRFDAAGNEQWGSGGNPLFGSGEYYLWAVTGDGAGGLFALTGLTASWPLWDAVVQRISADGTRPWGQDGRLAGDLTGYQIPAALVADTKGGVIACWLESKSGAFQSDIYAQRLSSGGAQLWPTGGVLVCGGGQAKRTPSIVADGNGGAILAWADARFDGISQDDVYAQNVNAYGGLGSIVPGTAVGPGLATDGLFLAPPGPNPMTVTPVSLSFSLTTDADARLEIFDAVGRAVRLLHSGRLPAGRHAASWDGRDDRGAPTSGGVFFVTLRVGTEIRSRKIVRLGHGS